MSIIRAAIFAVASLLIAVSVSAADYPSQPIEVVTHASAGGGTDTTARTMLSVRAECWTTMPSCKSSAAAVAPWR